MKIRILVAILFMPVLVWANITSQTARSGPFVVSSSPQTIPAGFPFQQGSDLQVINVGPVGNTSYTETTLTLGSDYTVTGGGYNSQTQMQVGSIVLVGSGAHHVQLGDQVVIIRNVPVNQITSFSPTGPLTIQMIEQALDKQATLSQQLTEASGRSLRFQKGETLDGTLVKSARKGNFLAFNNTTADIQYWSIQSIVQAVINTLGYMTGVSTEINVRNFGATGDGVTNDSVAFQNAINLAAATGQKVIIPAGHYLVSNISMANVALEGTGVLDNGYPSGTSGTLAQGGSQIWVTDTVNNCFIVGPGTSVNGLVFYYPNQNNTNFVANGHVPITYPATIRIPGTSTYVATLSGANIEIQNCQFKNSYVFVQAGNLPYDNHQIGRIYFRNVVGYAVSKAFTFAQVADVISLDHVQVSRAWGDINDIGAPTSDTLGRYTMRNGIAFEFDTAVGVNFVDCFNFEYSVGIRATCSDPSSGVIGNPGIFAESSVVGCLFDQVYTPLKVDSGAWIETGKWSSTTVLTLLDNGGFADPNFPALIDISGTRSGVLGGLIISNSEFTGGLISQVKITGDTLTNLAINNCKFYAPGRATTPGSSVPYSVFFNSTAASATCTLTGNYVIGGAASQRGFGLISGYAAIVGNNYVQSMGYAYYVTNLTVLMLNDNVDNNILTKSLLITGTVTNDKTDNNYFSNP